MRRLVAVLTLIALLGAPAQPAAARSTVFTGSWEAIDTDDSHLILKVGAGLASVRVHLVDHYATFCINRGARTGIATVRGLGTVDGSTLTVTFEEIRCQNGTFALAGTWMIVHDQSTDSLEQNFGSEEDPIVVTYTRMKARGAD